MPEGPANDGTADEAAAGMAEARRRRVAAVSANMSDGATTDRVAAEPRTAAAVPANMPEGPRRRIRLPLVAGPGVAPLAGPVTPRLPAPALAEAAGVRALWLVAPDLARAEQVAAGFPTVADLELELADPSALIALCRDLPPGTSSITLAGKRLTRVVVADPDHAAALLAAPGDFEVVLLLSRSAGPWLRALASAPARLILRQPARERLTESAAHDLDLPRFFAEFTLPVPVEGVPACVLGRPPREPPDVFDGAQLAPDGSLEIFRYARRYIADGFHVKSLRCRTCRHDHGCSGMHINYVRAHGFAAMQPVAP